jgi:hypothetical protein
MAVRLYHLGRVQSHHRAAELLTRFELSQAAERTVRWLEGITAGRAEDLQLMYGVGGERLLPEVELDTLEGCRGSPRSASNRPPPASSSSTSTATYSIPPGSTTATAARSPRPSGGCSPAPWRSSPGAGPNPTRVPALGTPGGQPPATCRTSSVATPSRKPASSPHRVISQESRRPMGRSSPMTYSSAPAARARQPTNR